MLGLVAGRTFGEKLGLRLKMLQFAPSPIAWDPACLPDSDQTIIRLKVEATSQVLPRTLPIYDPKPPSTPCQLSGQ